MDLVDTATDAVIQLSELRLVPASVLASRLAVLESAASAHRAELLKRPSHCHTAPPRQAASTGQAIGPPTLPDELWHVIFLAERQRWRRLRMCMVCNAWLHAIRDDPETWRALVLTYNRRAVLDFPAGDFVRQMVDDGALPILGPHVRRLVPDLSWVTTVVQEGRTLPGVVEILDQPDTPGANEILERRYFEVAWPVLSALCGLSFPSLRKLAVDLDVLNCQYCAEHAPSVVFRWLRDDLPAGLELLKLDCEEMGTAAEERLRELEKTHHRGLLDRYVNLKGLDYFKYEPLPKTCFDPDGMQQALEVLEWGDFFRCTDGELEELAFFENLRMLQIEMSAPTPKDLFNLCEVMPASVKVLYLSWDTSEPWSCVDWGILGALQDLVELCVSLDSCFFFEWAGPADITSHLAQLLPKTTILIAECRGVGGENGPNEIGLAPHITDREFLPLRVPDWHRLPGVYQPPVES